MKKWMGALCALLMLPALALADGERFSVAELREQAEALGRWTKTYEAHGRTIGVDIPICIPEEDVFPVVTIVPHALFEGENSCKVDIEDEDTGAVYEADLYTASMYDSVHVRTNTPSELLYAQPKDYLKQEKACYYPWEIAGREQMIFAEENPLSLYDVERMIKNIVDGLYGENEGYSLEYAEIRARPRRTKSDTDMNLGEPVAYYPHGSYWLSLRPNVSGIPVYATAASLFDSDALAKKGIHDEGFARLSSLTMFADIMDAQSFQLKAILLKRQETLTENAPLAPVSKVIESIEEEIMAGRVRKLYVLRLGYVCFLNESSPEAYTLFPTWLCECDYTQTAKEEGSVYILDAGIRDGTKFALLGVNAVTGETFDRRNPTWELMDCPE